MGIFKWKKLGKKTPRCGFLEESLNCLHTETVKICWWPVIITVTSNGVMMTCMVSGLLLLFLVWRELHYRNNNESLRMTRSQAALVVLSVYGLIFTPHKYQRNCVTSQSLQLAEILGLDFLWGCLI